MKLLVCVSMFNEADTILDVLHRLHSATDADILVVDDGSTDGSKAAIEASGFSPPHYIRHRRNQGPGFALRTGFRFAVANQYDHLVTIDSDGQHLPEEIARLLDALPQAEVVTGSRFHPDSPEMGVAPSWRLSANRALVEIVRRHTGYAITDSACGLRAYGTSALQRLRIRQSGYVWPYELWGQMSRMGFSVAEVPVTRIYQSEGEFAPSDSRDLVRMIHICESVLLSELAGESVAARFVMRFRLRFGRIPKKPSSA